MRTRKRILKEREIILLEETLAGRIEMSTVQSERTFFLSKNTF